MSWIKVDCMLIHKPKVIKIARELSLKRETVLGYLIKFWSLIDGITEDGRLDGYGPEEVDDLVGLTGFGKALEGVDWLRFTSKGTTLPRFDLHNGESAKKRANAALRQSRFKRNRNNAKVTLDALPTALPEALHREEKRRIDSGESIAPACACEGTLSPSPVFSLKDAYALAEAKGWLKGEVDKWWLWHDARGWVGMVNWESSLALWMHRVRADHSEQADGPVKIGAPTSQGLEMDVDVELG